MDYTWICFKIRYNLKIQCPIISIYSSLFHMLFIYPHKLYIPMMLKGFTSLVWISPILIPRTCRPATKPTIPRSPLRTFHTATGPATWSPPRGFRTEKVGPSGSRGSRGCHGGTCVLSTFQRLYHTHRIHGAGILMLT